jgi:hypothetical protein
MSDKQIASSDFSDATQRVCLVQRRAQEIDRCRRRRAGIPAAQDRDQAARLWEQVTLLLPSQREQRVAYLLYHCGLSPAEIVHLCPREFPDVEEVSHLRSTVFKRLQPLLALLQKVR